MKQERNARSIEIFGGKISFDTKKNLINVKRNTDLWTVAGNLLMKSFWENLAIFSREFALIWWTIGVYMKVVAITSGYKLPFELFSNPLGYKI